MDRVRPQGESFEQIVSLGKRASAFLLNAGEIVSRSVVNLHIIPSNANAVAPRRGFRCLYRCELSTAKMRIFLRNLREECLDISYRMSSFKFPGVTRFEST